MLDQSFSAKNLEVIFDLENRKGNIDIDWMPETYRNAAAEMKELRRQISELKGKGRKKLDEDVKKIDELEKSYKSEKEKKENGRKAFLKDCEDSINSKDFEIKMNKFVDDSGKEVFTLNLDEPAVFFALKQLQYNIHKTFKVKQANRHAILSDLKALLHTRVPLHIVRTDISSFYESIPRRTSPRRRWWRPSRNLSPTSNTRRKGKTWIRRCNLAYRLRLKRSDSFRGVRPFVFLLSPKAILLRVGRYLNKYGDGRL